MGVFGIRRQRLYVASAILLCGLLLLAAVGCDKKEYPVIVKNDLAAPIVFQVLGHFGEKVRIAKITDEAPLQDDLLFMPGEEANVGLARVRGVPQYTFVLETTQGTELFRRTLTRAELDERDWHITITEAGIE